MTWADDRVDPWPGMRAPLERQWGGAGVIAYVEALRARILDLDAVVRAQTMSADALDSKLRAATTTITGLRRRLRRRKCTTASRPGKSPRPVGQKSRTGRSARTSAR